MTKDAAGPPLSGCSGRGLELLERGLREFRCLRGDPVASAEAALREAPGAGDGARAARLAAARRHRRPRVLPQVRESLAQAARLPCDAREAAHLRAIGQFCAGRWRDAAAARWKT